MVEVSLKQGYTMHLLGKEATISRETGRRKNTFTEKLDVRVQQTTTCNIAVWVKMDKVEKSEITVLL